MKMFDLRRDMLNLSGQFYPTGHIVAMFPGAREAEAAARALSSAHIVGGEDVSLITPEAMMQDIVRTIGNADMPLPSPGTESDTVRRFSQYASQGHYGLLIRTPRQDDDERVMQALRDHHVSHAQKYRTLVIEDLA